MYGNIHALEALLRAADQERVEKIVFNGDFNWFNGDVKSFTELNLRLMKLCDEGRAICTTGNVEREIVSDTYNGCGCGYPNYVSDAAVERSNEIMRGLQAARAGAQEGEIVSEWLQGLPLFVKDEPGLGPPNSDIANRGRRSNFLISASLRNQNPQAAAAKAICLRAANAEIANYGRQTYF